jgi:hypothetical protein
MYIYILYTYIIHICSAARARYAASRQTAAQTADIERLIHEFINLLIH